MRLRWITVLGTLALKLFLMVVLLLLGKGVLQKNYAALEREHAESAIEQVSTILQSQLKDLDLSADNYASWDVTSTFLRTRNAVLLRRQLPREMLSLREVHLLLVADRRGKLLYSDRFTGDPGISFNDQETLMRVAMHRRSELTPALGFINLSHASAIVSVRPVLSANRARSPAGTLLLVRFLNQRLLNEISRLAEVPVTISGLQNDPSATSSIARLQHGEITTSNLNSETLAASTKLLDVWGHPTVRLEIRHSRFIWKESQSALRALVLLLLVVGLLFAFLNMWLMQRFVVRRVERLIRLTEKVDSEDALGARAQLRGSDEIAQLGRHMNQMLDRLQNSQEKLLAVQQRLRFEATHDALTGIWNRAAALELMDRELARCARDNTSLAVIIFDADHFKRINDHFGHVTGDRALQAISAGITRNLRGFDTCARYGGEEFLVIAPSCDLQHAQQLATRILKHLRSTPIEVTDHAFCVTLSAGVTAGGAHSRTEDLIVVADRALYRAKANGRDRVEVEPMPLAKPVVSNRFSPASDALPSAIAHFK